MQRHNLFAFAWKEVRELIRCHEINIFDAFETKSNRKQIFFGSSKTNCSLNILTLKHFAFYIAHAFHYGSKKVVLPFGIS